MKIRPVRAQQFRADGQRDEAKSHFSSILTARLKTGQQIRRLDQNINRIHRVNIYERSAHSDPYSENTETAELLLSLGQA